MKYSTNNTDIAIRRKLHLRISFLNQTFKMFEIDLKDGFCFEFLQKLQNNSS